MLQELQAAFGPDHIGYFVRSQWRLSWAIALALVSMMTVCSLGMAQTPRDDEPIAFDIPAQPLEAALTRYGDVTGREALYDTSLAAGRTSGEVRGALTPKQALERLLLGTGLLARFVTENAFVLVPAPSANRQALRQAPSHRRYYGLIQANLLNSLCRSSSTRPGRYRIVVAFWIGRTGIIENLRRVGSAGSADVDQQIDATLRSVRLNEPPPADFAQPVLILLMPQAPGMTPPCYQADDGIQPARMTP
ncbi:TonB-dependent outer membrane receptor [Bradyrhizobium sp. CSA112]|uniref:STN domain-containing protein n=1 Tax=Bradyrhizobium sp. CSA112 TaxID=2699170 RepID=UPI0023B00389|nr:secretin and TonB N-terminal domain-containing protein [Bradyrhizobium sp. CSA112]MDE5458295.1 TonB-dependent outer membrane receptor [Bradyrhizobium sp. CSA112]